MKKAITTIVLVAFAATCFIGCSSSETTSGSATEAEPTSTAEVTTTTTTEATTTTTEATTTTEPTLSRTISADSKKLDELLAKQPLYVSKTRYIVQDKYYKSLYPDLLCAIITNKSKDDIKNALLHGIRTICR